MECNRVKKMVFQRFLNSVTPYRYPASFAHDRVGCISTVSGCDTFYFGWPDYYYGVCYLSINVIYSC